MRKLPLAALLMCGFSVAQMNLDPERTMKQLDVKARQFTGMICDTSYGASTLTLQNVDSKYAQQHMTENYKRLWNKLDPKTRKIIKQFKSTSPLSYMFYVKDKNESYFSHSWYEPTSKAFSKSFCVLKALNKD